MTGVFSKRKDGAVTSIPAGLTQQLFILKGSLYKICYRELLVFLLTFGTVSVVYHHALNDYQKRFTAIFFFCISLRAPNTFLSIQFLSTCSRPCHFFDSVASTSFRQRVQFEFSLHCAFSAQVATATFDWFNTEFIEIDSDPSICSKSSLDWFKSVADSAALEHEKSMTFCRAFEKVVIYARQYMDLVSLPFLLGFYITVVANRWWQQYLTIPWPDR